LENQETIENLLDRTDRSLPEDPSALYQAIGQIFQNDEENINDEEAQTLINILWHITTEIELSMRIKLADKLANRNDVPSELMYMLASDDIRVAYNVLVRGDALADDNLIKIVRHRTKRHQLAITARKNLSEVVSNELVATNDKDVIVALLNNSNASISRNTLSYIVDESQRVDAYQQPLIRRDDMPSDLIERMCTWISDELLELINEKHSIDVSAFRYELRSASHELGEKKENSENAEFELIKQIFETGGLNETFLTDTLVQGHITLFEHGIAALIGLERENALSFIYDYGEEGLAVLCRAGAFSDKNYLVVRRLIGQSKGKAISETMADREILLARLAELNSDQVSNILASVEPKDSRKKFLRVFYEIFDV
jgi:uncharacterized protein (DUF2336 family)